MIRKTFSILNCGVGNFNSIAGVISKIGHIPIITSKIIEVKRSDFMVLPGVGTYPESIKKIKRNNLFNFLRHQIKSGKPTLGICLGMQLFASFSEEIIKTKGLNIIPGSIKKNAFNAHHIGWNKLYIPNKKCVFNSLDNKEFYFQHNYSYYGSNKYIRAYSEEKNFKIPSIIKNKNVIGVQFHPEKSQENGIHFFKKFVEIFK